MQSINSFHGEFRWLSNFWPCKVNLRDLEFPTLEHAFQAAKTSNIEERIVIQKLEKPGQAKRAGKKVTIRPEWPELKLKVMENLLRQKFSDRNPELKQLLINTGNIELIEGNNWNDVFWGICNGVGENNLGKLLMKIRAELQNLEAK